MDFLKLVIAAIIIFAIGIGTGYFYAPTKIQEKIVEKEVTKKEEYKKKTKKYDKDGKVIEESEETGTKETNSNTTKNEKTTENEKARKVWAAKVGVAVDAHDLHGKLIPRVGGEVRLPIFDSWVGVEGDINVDKPLLGAYLRVEF